MDLLQIMEMRLKTDEIILAKRGARTLGLSTANPIKILSSRLKTIHNRNQ